MLRIPHKVDQEIFVLQSCLEIFEGRMGTMSLF
jgi:hypothetical protein